MTRLENLNKDLCLLDSQHVAEWFAREGFSVDSDTLRQLLLDHWPRCDAHREYRDELVQLFRKAGFVADEKLPKYTKSVRIYRGNLGEDEPVGISWTLSVDVAKKFALYGMSPRAMFLGIYRSDGIPTVWEAKIDVKKILGYFNCRKEKEVVVDPADLESVWKIMEAK